MEIKKTELLFNSNIDGDSLFICLKKSNGNDVRSGHEFDKIKL